MGRPRGYHTKGRKSDREANTTWHQFYVESKLGHKGTYLQNRNRLTNMQNEFMATKEMAGGDKLGV